MVNLYAVGKIVYFFIPPFLRKAYDIYIYIYNNPEDDTLGYNKR